MKIVGGCFGCLAFVFFVLFWVSAPIMAALLPMLYDVDPDLGNTATELVAYVNYANGTCCCLSAAMAIVFVAVGSMGKKGAADT